VLSARYLSGRGGWGRGWSGTDETPSSSGVVLRVTNWGSVLLVTPVGVWLPSRGGG